MTQMLERVAWAIADQIGDGFDSAHRDKPHWIETRGESGGRYRDINEPRQSDYLDAARAALEAMLEPGDLVDAAGPDLRVEDWQAMIRKALGEG